MINEVNEKLKLDLKSVTTWFSENHMFLNYGKCAWVAKLKRLSYCLMEKSLKIPKKKLFPVLL